MLNEKAKLITKKIIKDLSDRSGFDGWWDQIDDEIQREIRDSITKIIITESYERSGGYD